LHEFVYLKTRVVAGKIDSIQELLAYCIHVMEYSMVENVFA